MGDRKLRMIRYNYYVCLESLQNFTWQLVVYTMVFRFVCLWLGIGWLMQKILCLIGFRRIVTKHQSWFSNASSMYVSEPSIWWVVGKIWNIASNLIVKVRWGLCKYAASLTILGMVVLSVAVVGVTHLVTEQRGFAVRWKRYGQNKALDFGQNKVLSSKLE